MQRLVHLLLCGTTAGCLITPGIRDDRQDQLDQTDPAVIVRVLHPDGRPLPDASVELIGGPDGVVQTNAAGWVKRLAAPAHGEWVIRASRGGFAPTSSPVDVKADAVGLTLVLSRLQEGRVVRSSQTVNEAGRRALAFPTGVVATHGSVDLEHVFASTHDAPNALGLDQFDNRVTLDVFDAVYVAGSVADVLDGQPLTYRVQEVPGSPLAAAPDDQVSLWRFDLTQGMWLEEERWRAGAATTEQPNTHWLAWLDSFDTWYAIAAPTDGDPVELQTLDPGGSRMAHVEVRLTEPGLVSAKRFQTNKNGVVFDGVPLLGSQGSVHLLRRLQNTGGLALVEQMPFGPQTPPIQVPVFADADRDDYWTDGRCAAGDCEQAYQWGDCDDTDRNVHPGLSKDSANNGIDDNCDGLVDGVDLDRDGVDAEVDCDDTDPTRTPGTMALCVPDDDNCNGVADETEVHLAPRPPDTSLANGDTCHRCEIQTLIDTDPVLYIPFDDESTTWASDRSGWGRDLAISNLTERGPGIDHRRLYSAQLRRGIQEDRPCS